MKKVNSGLTLSFFTSSIFIFTLFSCVSAQATTEYPGWVSSVDKKKNAIVYRPKTENKSVDIFVKYYPPTLLEHKTVDVWLDEKLRQSKAPKGMWAGEPSVTKATANLAYGSRHFKRSSGIKGRIEAVLFTADKLYARLAVTILSETQANAPYVKQSAKILSNIIQEEKAKALAEKRGIDIEAAPPKVEGLKVGVKIKPGRYVGSTTRGNEIWRRNEIMLYASGEYEFLTGKDSGRYAYSQATGRLNLEDDFYNSRSNPSRDFCVFGVDEKTGQHIIYAKKSRIDRVSRLVWVSDVDRPSPSEQKRLKALEEAEKRRYKHVTAPGNGISPDNIKTIMYASESRMGFGGLEIDEEIYLVMKDGRIMDGIPVAPTVLDLAKSQSREPDRWGWWKQGNNGYTFAWNADKKNYTVPSGSQINAKPIPKGMRFDGTWSTSSSFVSLDFSSTSFCGVIFKKNGRFEKYKNGITQAGGEMSGLGPMVTAVSDDEGSAVSIVGSNVGGGSSTKFNKTNADRVGSYFFDGYNLTLKFDDGKVKHLPTFTLSDTYKSIWFEGNILSRKEKN